MAQKFYNFQDALLGDIPPYMELRRNAVAAEYQISEDIDGKFLRYFSTRSSSAKGVAYTDIPSEGATEVYAEIRDLDKSNPPSSRVVVFASDSPDNEYGVSVDLNFGSYGRISLFSRVGGTYSDIATSNFTPELLPSPDSYFKLLLQVVPGSPNQLRVKFWLSGQDEPLSWRLDTTNNSMSLSGGWIGHVGFAQNDEVRYRAVGIGTDGDPAPTEPVGSGATVDAETENAEFQYNDGTTSAGAAVFAETYQAEFDYLDGAVLTGASVLAETYGAQFNYYDADIASGVVVDAEVYQWQSQYFDGTVTVGEPVVFIKTVELAGLYRKNVTLSGNYRKRVQL